MWGDGVKYLSVTGEYRHRGWVSSTLGGAPLQRFSTRKKRLKQDPRDPFPFPSLQWDN